MSEGKGRAKGKERSRRCELARRTRETKVELELDLDGTGTFDVRIEDPFLRHMVETLARYSEFDLRIWAEGDIDHHLIEDVAITLGAALPKALGDSPIRRLGSATVPMDDALVSVHVDLVDRPYVHIELPEDDIYEHFLRSFAMDARITLHTQVLRGKDRHPITEATFKALGRALNEATRPGKGLLSTKSKVDFQSKR
jgi:imidazoleglycerol-phosphate dehydratase